MLWNTNKGYLSLPWLWKWGSAFLFSEGAELECSLAHHQKGNICLNIWREEKKREERKQCKGGWGEGTFVSCRGKGLHGKQSHCSPLRCAVLSFTFMKWASFPYTTPVALLHPSFLRTEGLFLVEESWTKSHQAPRPSARHTCLPKTHLSFLPQ